MKQSIALVITLILFSLSFFALRAYGEFIGYDVTVLVSDLGGLAYLYSAVGTMFAIFAGFVIVSESQDWNTLNAASRDEIQGLSEMVTWSRKLSKRLANEFRDCTVHYLKVVTKIEWVALRDGHIASDATPILEQFHELVLAASLENEEIGSHISSAFSDFLNHRSVRLEYSWQPIPSILKLTLLLVDTSLVGLSFFIGVRNMWLDYVFMLCIVTLGAVVLIVVDDLDNPLRPGDWWLKPERYEGLLHLLERETHVRN